MVFGATSLIILPGCSEKSVKYTDLKKLLLHEDFEGVFDSQVISKVTKKQSYSEDQLIEKIFQENLPKTKAEVLQQIHLSAKQDFKSGKTVIIDGWVFSDTVVKFAALQHKLNKIF